MRSVGIRQLGLVALMCMTTGCSDPVSPDVADTYELERIDRFLVPGAVLGGWAIRSGMLSFEADGTCFRFQTADRVGEGSPSVRISMAKCGWNQEGRVISLSWDNGQAVSLATIRGNVLTLELRAGAFCMDQACDSTRTERYTVSVGAPH